MAEAFGLAAGVVGIASLSVQLVDSLQKLQNFHHTYREAPTEVKDLIKELQLVEALLQNLPTGTTNASLGPLNPSLFDDCKQWCENIKDDLLTVIQALNAKLDQQKRRTSLKYMFKEDIFHKWFQKLERAKTLLLLCKGVCDSKINEQNIEECRRDAASILAGQATVSRSLAGIVQESHGTVTSVNTLQSDSRTLLESQSSTTNALSIVQLDTQKALGIQQRISNCTESTSVNVRSLTADINAQKGDIKHLADTSNTLVTFQQALHHDTASIGTDVTTLLQLGRAQQNAHQDLVGNLQLILQEVRNSQRTNVVYKHNASSEDVTVDAYRFRTRDRICMRKPTPFVVRIGLPTWLCRQKWEAEFSRGIAGWKFALRFPHVLPSSAKVWELCEVGDIEGVKTLLTRGEISLHCENEYGGTMLHYATYNLHAELFRFLLNEGANHLCYDETGRTPIITAVVGFGNHQLNPNAFGSLKDISRFYADQIAEELSHHYSEFVGGARLLIPEENESMTLAEKHDCLVSYVGEAHPIGVIQFGDLRGMEEYLEMFLSECPKLLAYRGAFYEETDSIIHFAARCMAVSTSPYWPKLIQRTLAASADPSQLRIVQHRRPCNWDTPLGHYMSSIRSNTWYEGESKISSQQNRTTEGLTKWIALLDNCGVDLVAYGDREIQIYKEAREDVLRRRKAKSMDEIHWFRNITGFSHGPNPRDWAFRQTNPGDDFAGHFWALIDRPVPVVDLARRIVSIKQQQERTIYTLPGGMNRWEFEDGKQIRCLEDVATKLSFLHAAEYQALSDLLCSFNVDNETIYDELNLAGWVLAELRQVMDAFIKKHYGCFTEIAKQSWKEMDADTPYNLISDSWIDFASNDFIQVPGRVASENPHWLDILDWLSY